MATRIGALFVDLNLNTQKFIDELDRSRTKSTAFGVAVGTIFANIAASAGRMAADAALSIPRLIASQIDLADALGKTSQRIGISVESLSVLKHQAELADVSFESLAAGIGRFSKNVSDAVQKPTGDAAKAMRQLGIDLEGVRKGTVNIDEAFLQAADGVAAMGNQFQRTDAGIAAFGKGFQELVPVLNQGRQGFKDAGEEVDRFGIRITTAMARNAEVFNDNIKRMQSAGAGFGITLTNELLPPLAGFTNAMLDAIGPGKELHGLVAGFALPFKGLLEVLTLASGSLRILVRDFRLIGEVGILATKFDTEGIKVAFKQFETDVRKIREQTTKSLAEISGVKPLDPITILPTAEEFETGLTPLTATMRAWAERLGLTIKDNLEIQVTPALLQAIEDARKIQPEPIVIPVDLSGFQKDLLQTGFFEALNAIERSTAEEKIIGLTKSIEALNQELAIGPPVPFLTDDAIEKMVQLPKDLDKVKSKVTELADTGKQIGVAISGGIEEAMRKWEGFGNLAIGILDDIAATILRNAVTAPLSTWLGTIFSSVLPAVAGGIGGGVGGGGTVLSSTAVAGPSSIGVPLFAEGGEPPVGKASLVGERGPELFVPKVAGTIYSNNWLKKLPAMGREIGWGGGGGKQATVINYNIDARGAAPGVGEEIRRALSSVEDRAVSRAVRTVQELKLRTV